MRSIISAIVMIMLFVITGCMGTFKLTRDVYEWNGSSCDRWAREAMFLTCQVLPVYGIALAGDVLVTNPIEFWKKDVK